MGKGGDRGVEKTTTSAEKVEVLIDGRFYDVTNLKHPGGSVINFYAGKEIDASQAFSNFHLRSKKAKKLLDSLPSRVADEKKIAKNALPGQVALLKDFDDFKRQLEDEGFFKPSPAHAAYRILEILVMYSAGFYLILQRQFLLGLVLAGIAEGRCGWLMHEAGHYSLTGNIPVDKALQAIIYGVGCGMSGSWWRVQHNKHHSMPQKLGHDVDLNTLPLVAFTEKVRVYLCVHPFLLCSVCRASKLWMFDAVCITQRSLIV
jgi:acyl-CoA 6-desaturase (Delta-6 desaturase)